MTVLATSLAPIDAMIQLADPCRMSEEETTRVAGATADGAAELPPAVATAIRSWIQQHGQPLLVGRSVPGGVPSEGDGTEARPNSSSELCGSRGNLPVHEHHAWTMREEMVKGWPVPDSTLSQLPALKEVAVEVAAESSDALDEVVHPYIEILLEAPASVLWLEVEGRKVREVPMSVQGANGGGEGSSGPWAEEQLALSPSTRGHCGRSTSGGINYAQIHSRGQNEEGAASMDSVLVFAGSEGKMRMSRSASQSGSADLRTQLASGTPIADAVKTCILSGGTEGSLEQVQETRDQSEPLLAVAPDDEVLGEILALQAELVQQVAQNRGAVGNMLQSMLEDLPRQREAAKRRKEGEVDNERHVEAGYVGRVTTHQIYFL